MKKRILSIVLALLMMIGLLPFSAFADTKEDVANEIEIYVNGKKLGFDETVNCGRGTAKLVYEDNVPKLVLDNAEIGVFHMTAEDTDTKYYGGIVYKSNLNTLAVVVKGNCSINAPTHDASSVYEGIISTASVVITGDSLSINGVDIGIECWRYGIGTVTLDAENSELNIAATSCGIYADRADFYTRNAEICSSGSCAVMVNSLYAAKSNVTVMLIPDAAYGEMSTMAVSARSIVLTDYAELNVANEFDARGYNGEEICAAGAVCNVLSIDDSAEFNGVTKLKGSASTSASVLMATEIRSDSPDCCGYLNAVLMLDGEHAASTAVSADRVNANVFYNVRVTGARKNDVAMCSVYPLDSGSITAELEGTGDYAYGALIFGVSEGSQTFTEPPVSMQRVEPSNGSYKKLTVDNANFYVVLNSNGSAAEKIVLSAEISEQKYNPFVDISDKNETFREAILWAYGNKITGGTDSTHFNPDGTCTRANVVTFLWRAAGEPQPESRTNPFSDVAAGSYYYNAVLWAVEKGIVSGYDDGTFRPNAACTRAHVVTFLWRYENKPEAAGTVSLTDIAGLNSDFAAAINWAAIQGITSGYDDGSFRPNDICTRAHVVTFLWRNMTKG